MGTIEHHHPQQDWTKRYRKIDVFLQDAVKDGLTRLVIQGLTRKSESYKEAIKCLNKHYDQPQLVHKEHVRNIMDMVPVKNGSDKELRHLYDAAIQHY